MPRAESLALYLFLFGLAVRLGCLVATFEPGQDVAYYEDVQIALNLVEGDGYVLASPWGVGPVRPTAAKAPAYPLLVAAVFALFGRGNFLALFLLQAVLSAATCVVLFRSLEGVTSDRTRTVAGFAMALYPPFVYHAVTTPESTTLLLLVTATFLHQLLELGRGPTRPRWVVAGALGAAMVLTDPVTMPLVGLSLLLLARIHATSLRATIETVALVGAVAAGVMAPWTVRNYLVFERPVLVKTNLGWTLLDGLARAGIQVPEAPTPAEATDMNEADEDRFITGLVVTWIRRHPTEYAAYMARNVREFWWETASYRDDRSLRYLAGRRAPYLLLLLASAPGVVLAVGELFKSKSIRSRRHVFVTVALLLMVTYTVTHTVVGAFLLRYHFPIELVLFGFLGLPAALFARSLDLEQRRGLRGRA